MYSIIPYKGRDTQRASISLERIKPPVSNKLFYNLLAKLITLDEAKGFTYLYTYLKGCTVTLDLHMSWLILEAISEVSTLFTTALR